MAKTTLVAGDAPADDTVVQALVKLALAEAPMRLSGRGDHPALFPTATGGNKAAIDRCRDGADPLLVDVGAGKSEYVRLTAAGFLLALPHLPADRVGAAATDLSAVLPAAQRAEFLNEIIRRTPAAAGELLPAFEAAVAAEKGETEARLAEAAERRESDEVTRQALTRWLELLDELKRQRVAALRRELEAESVPPAGPPDLSGPPPLARLVFPPLAPATTEDVSFRREMARRVVSAWIDAWDADKADAREFLGTAIWNMTGFLPIGEAGGELAFDEATQEGPDGLDPGDPVRVVRPGWALEEDGREYVVARAVVEAG